MLRSPRTDELRALLRSGEPPRLSFYLTSPESLGFADLTPPFFFGPGQPAYTVMGAALPVPLLSAS